jgi:large subunit ribosomal protein L54
MPAGQLLKGLNYLKNKTDPIAREDAYYPSWLWNCLSDSKSSRAGASENGAEEEGDLFCELFCLSSLVFLPLPCHAVFQTQITDRSDVNAAKSKKQRRLAAKRLKKLAEMNPEGVVKKVPLEQQSVDLPSNAEGTAEGEMEARSVREEITKRLRVKRRQDIKTGNFLKGMR